jgi:hypothetical protein
VNLVTLEKSWILDVNCGIVSENYTRKQIFKQFLSMHIFERCLFGLSSIMACNNCRLNVDTREMVTFEIYLTTTWTTPNFDHTYLAYPAISIKLHIMKYNNTYFKNVSRKLTEITNHLEIIDNRAKI